MTAITAGPTGAIEIAVPIANTIAPSISGSAVVGRTLTCHRGTWVGGPTAYTFQWQRETGVGTGSYTDIGGETDDTYVCAAADLGLRLRCEVDAT